MTGGVGECLEKNFMTFLLLDNYLNVTSEIFVPKQNFSVESGLDYMGVTVVGWGNY